MRLLYIRSRYPSRTETFIDREIKELRRHMSVSVLSLRRSGAAGVLHLPLFSPEALVSCIRVFARQPVTFLDTLFSLIRMHLSNPGQLQRSLAVFPLSAAVAERIASRRLVVDRVHAGWATVPASSAYIISRLSGLSYSFSAHAWDIYLNRGSLYEKAESAAFVATCTEYNRKAINEITRNRFRKKVHRIYHGLDIRPVRRSPANPPLVLAVGSLREKKGHIVLLRACELLRHDFRCVIIGDGPERRSLERYLASSKIKGKVALAGYRDFAAVSRYYARAGVLVMSSVIDSRGDRDGLPNVILEAMLCRVPVIASRISGIPEAVVHGRTGLLVRPGRPAELAKAIDRVLAQPALAERLTENAHSLAKARFDVRRNTAQLAGLLK